MLRSLLLVAILANVFWIVTSAGDVASSSSSSSSATSSTKNGASASSSSSSSSSTTYNSEDVPDREPEKCPDNEQATSCIQAKCSGQTCAQKGQIVMCPAVPKHSCRRGCICIDNYLRSQNGSCIPEDDCDSEPICGDGEVLVNCPRDCSSQNCPTSENEDDPPCMVMDDCPPPQCRCQDNYLRSDNGTCIPSDSCPKPVCGTGEVLVNCPRDCSSQNCPTSEDEDVIPCSVLDDCPPPQCRCRDDYLRSENGTCIPADSCPEICPVNEKSTSCIQYECGGQSCALKGKPAMSCPAILESSCQRGCICIYNYLRSQNGTCIPEDDCDSEPICGDGEVLVNCPRDCSSQNCPTSEDEDDPPCMVMDDCPPPQCRCQDNYLRSDNGTCIPADSCPELCPVNEKSTSCIQADCGGQSCARKGQPAMSCPLILEGSCQQGCICIDNYLRSQNGTCIPEDDCDYEPICGDNEVLINCPRDCSSQNCPTSEDEDVIPCSVLDDCPPPQCRCQDNYLRSDNGTCIPSDSCPEPVCGKGEVLVNCPSDCSSEYCPTSEDEEIPPCAIMDDCPPSQCKCRDNYLRADNGTCIPIDSCPPFDCSTRPNEEYVACPPMCPDDTCSQASPNGTCPLLGEIGIVNLCYPKCRCIDGYWRNDNGTCIPYSECPGVCAPNEVFSNCTQVVCRALNCTQKGKPVACPFISEGSCETGCICEEGYLRAENGTCVPEDQCDNEPICDDEEVLDSCPRDCSSDYCPTSDDDDAPCTIMDDCPPPECKCRFNYKRSDNGTCIPTTSCPPYDCSDKPNEEYDPCPPFCTDSCNEATPTGDCHIFGRIDIIFICNPKCRCMKGYWRNDDGICVPYAECPGICPSNEIYSNCTQSACRIQNCTQQELDIECLDISDDSCKAGCICDEGFLRGENGTCVLDDECNDGQCPSPDEEFSSCIQAICRAQNCSQQGTPFECADVDEDSCESGCICKVGFLRADSGTCIQEDDCSSVICSDPNEEPSSCMQAVCRAKTCADNGTIICDTIEEGYCEAGCLCKVGFLRADNGTCIAEDDCNQEILCLDPNEESSSCIQAVCRAQNCTQKGQPVVCAGVAEGSCQPGCVCAVGYLRAENGTCVPEDECDQCAGPNEQYTECRSICTLDTCISLILEIGFCDEEQLCEPGCTCAPGFLRRNSTEPCMPECDCPEMADSPYC